MGGRSGELGPVSVLESRLRAPRAQATTVLRARLMDAMAAAETQGRTVTVVSAPAGAGKTVLLSQRWARLRSARSPTAWLRLDESDNDPMRFWSGILAACVRARRDSDGSASAELKALRSPHNPLDGGFLAAWHAALAPPDDRPLWLIIDDVNALTESSALDSLARILRTAPAWLRVILGTRHDLPLAIPRMVVSGTASEIRSADLAFDRAEARELLSRHGIDLSSTDLSLLMARTEGWAAGLKLAAESLAQQEEVSSHIAAFAGDSRPVADYLVHEVLARLAADIKEFLLSTAVPDNLTAELADDLTGRVDSGSVLDRLARENVFTYRHDSSPTLYHYHPLLRSYLLAELSRTDARAVARLHAHVSDWFAARDAPAEALGHAVMAGDWAGVADLIGRYGLRLLLSGDARTLQQALAAMPDKALADVGMALLETEGALQNGDTTAAGRQLDRVGRDPTRHADPRRRLLHAAVLIHEARLRGDRSRRVYTLIEQTRSNSPTDLDVTLLATAGRGMMLAALGDIATAEADLTVGAKLARRHHRDRLALECLSRLALGVAAPGNPAEMLARSREAIEFAGARGRTSPSAMIHSYLAAGWGAWEEMDVRTAEQWAGRATQITTEVEPAIAISVRILEAYLASARTGDSRSLAGRLRMIWERGAIEYLAPAAVSYYCITDLRTALSLGDTGWTNSILTHARNLLGPEVGDVVVLESMVDTYHDRLTAARHRMAAVLKDERSCVAATAKIAAWLLAADLAAAGGEPSRAHEALVRALGWAAPARAIRPIVGAPPRVRRLLLHEKGRFGEHEDFVGLVLEVASRVEGTAASLNGGGPLTARELELLRDLQSQLSVNEIAQSQSVSVNTVKTHLKALYRKFDVGSRRAAVERGRELGLL